MPSILFLSKLPREEWDLGHLLWSTTICILSLFTTGHACFGDSMTKFQLTWYKLNKCPKHPTIHLTIRKRVNLTGSHQGLNSLTIGVQLSTNSNLLRILVENHLLTNRLSVFETQVTWEFGLFPSSKAQKTLA